MTGVTVYQWELVAAGYFGSLILLASIVIIADKRRREQQARRTAKMIYSSNYGRQK